MKRILHELLVLCATTAMSLSAQTFTTLRSFDVYDGGGPFAGLVQGTDGNFYGTDLFAGSSGGGGAVYKLTPGGTVTTLHGFCPIDSGCPDGARPYAGLVQGVDGDFYGTTTWNSVFKITPTGALTTLYSFCSQGVCPDGESPHAALVQATDGDFYGTATSGGVNGGGTVFRFTTTGALTMLYSFCSLSACVDGKSPFAGLIQAADGNLYGTTQEGGANGIGTVFEITPSGTLITLSSFSGQSGAYPKAGLVQATDGDFYGTTVYGGAYGGGTIFKITASGALTALYSFCSRKGCPDGGHPSAELIQATDGNFYGITPRGGANGGGTVFQITAGGTLTTLYSFCSESGCADGKKPYAALIQATDGDFYGTTFNGGTYSIGTVFSLSLGLGPLVRTRPAAGKVGAAVKILGTNLTGASSVSFNGTTAAFSVLSPSLITATIPAGATTGEVQVVTPTGTLSSNVPFRVLL